MSNSEFVYNRNHPRNMIPFSTVHPPYNKREREDKIYPAVKAVEQTRVFIKDCYGLDGHPVLDRKMAELGKLSLLYTAEIINNIAISLLIQIQEQTPLIRKKEKAYAAD